jgi:hypothetical protein
MRHLETRVMDPSILYYGKGQMSYFLADPDCVLDVVSTIYTSIDRFFV